MGAPAHTDRVNAFFDLFRKTANDSGYGSWVSDARILQEAYAAEAVAERFDPPSHPPPLAIK